jgi:hypothetical protein
MKKMPFLKQNEVRYVRFDISVFGIGHAFTIYRYDIRSGLLKFCVKFTYRLSLVESFLILIRL